MKRNTLIRRRVFERDQGICAVCGRYDPKWQHDHIVARWEGGPDTLENSQTLCRRCHAAGDVCALGSVGKGRGIDLSKIDPADRVSVAAALDIAEALAAEVAYINDDGNWKDETPEERFARVRRWVESKLIEWEPHA